VSFSEIHARDLSTLGNVAVIDVREIDEYLSGHVPGAINFPLSTLVENFSSIPMLETLYVVCQVGGRSARACEFLSQQEQFSHCSLINVQGGTGAWILEGNEVVTGDSPN
jgi:rhodanese-related sulfurtransferase